MKSVQKVVMAVAKSPPDTIIVVGEFKNLSVTASRASGKRRWQFRLLASFGWFCGQENRMNLAAMQRDLEIEEREMRHEGRGSFFVGAALGCRSVAGGILPILADGIWRVIRPNKGIRGEAK